MGELIKLEESIISQKKSINEVRREKEKL